MPGHGDQVNARRRQGDRPGLGLVEVGVAGQRAAARRRVVGMGQHAARPVEVTAVAVVAGDEADHDVGAARHRHLGKAQRCHRRPQTEGLGNGGTHLGGREISGEVLETVGQVVARPLAALQHELGHVWKATARLRHQGMRCIIELAGDGQAVEALEFLQRVGRVPIKNTQFGGRLGHSADIGAEAFKVRALAVAELFQITLQALNITALRALGQPGRLRHIVFFAGELHQFGHGD